MSFEGKKGKSQQIAERLETEIISGKLQPGCRMKSVREIADSFSVSLCSVQVALETLEEKGLIERKRGSGTFIREHNMTKDNTVYFLVPTASHITSKYEECITHRRLMYGAICAAAPGQLVQPIAVSRVNVRNLGENPELIDWEAIKRIPPGANVFVDCLWYKDIIPFLAERSVRGLLLAHQYEQECPEIFKTIHDAGWSIITLDRFTAIQRVLEYLHSMGRRKIVALKAYEMQPGHPFRRGFISGYEKCGMAFRDDFFQECPSEKWDSIENVILELWEKTKFDAMVSCIPDLACTVLNTLTKKLGLKVPDDVALMAFRDMPEYLETEPQISAFEFPLVDVGAEIINVFNSKNGGPKDTRFHASIIERGSTIKGLNGLLTRRFMPELLSHDKKITELI